MRNTMRLKEMFAKTIFDGTKSREDLLEISDKIKNREFDKLDDKLGNLMIIIIDIVNEDEEEQFLDEFSKIVKFGANGETEKLRMINQMYRRKN